MKLNYSEPKIYTGGVVIGKWSKLTKADQKKALSKEWHVYFSFRDVETGNLKRQPNIKAGANRFHNKRDRYNFLKTLQRNLLLLLEAGFNPFVDNSALEQKFFGKKVDNSFDSATATKTTSSDNKIVYEITKTPPIDKKTVGRITKKEQIIAENNEGITKKSGIIAENKSAIERRKNGNDLASKTVNKKPEHSEKKRLNPINTEPVDAVPPNLNRQYSVIDAFEKGLKIKKRVLNENSYPKYLSHIKRFQKWLAAKGVEYIAEVDRTLVIEYLNLVLEKSSPRNRNNARSTISSFFTALAQNDIIKENFVLKINVLKTNPERNKTFTPEQLEKIDFYLDAHDPLLKLFIQFISYNFLRPIEVCRLKVGDLDILDKKLYVRAKNKAVKIKIIPDILINKIPNLSNFNKEHFLFTPEKIGGIWEVAETDRRNYFSTRFRKVKNHFKLGTDYGLYSYRHTFITKIYRELAKKATPLEVKSKLMVITGHTTQTALDKYLRDIDAVLPQDYSHLLKD